MFWPAILEVNNYRTPSNIFVHGFLTINGKKMSKSRGTFIKARTYLNYLNPEYLRYYFASKMTNKIEDIDLNFKDLMNKVNSDIIGKLINIASRCSNFMHKYNNGILSPSIIKYELINNIVNRHEEISRLFEQRDFAKAIRIIMQLTDQVNAFINHHKPWQLAKTLGNEGLICDVCSVGINLFKIIIGYLKPITPELVSKSEHFLNIPPISWNTINTLLLNHKINVFKPIAQRINSNDIDKIIKNDEEHLNKT